MSITDMCKTLTVAELHAKLSLLMVQGKGSYPVQLLTVHEGMTRPKNLVVEEAQWYDGERVWVYTRDV